MHYYTEMNRVKEGVRAWQEGDFGKFGLLMRESGKSSIVNYECGTVPLKCLYEKLNAVPGVLGARFSGAGFRGSCVVLTDGTAETVARIRETVKIFYGRAFPEYEKESRVRRCSTNTEMELP